MLPVAEPSILRGRTLSDMTPANFPAFGDQILHDQGPNSPLLVFLKISIICPSPEFSETPIFLVCVCFLYFFDLAFFHDSLDISKSACQKECYYVVSFLRGAFLCRDQIPFFKKFTVLPFGMLKATEATETPYSLVFLCLLQLYFF